MDALNFTLTLDHELTNELRNLDPHKSCFELTKPYSISGNLSVPKTVVATISNWMHGDEVGQTSMDKSFLDSVGV